jgi:phenylacetate-CoA ligase
VLRVPGLAPHFQLLLIREGRMDTMTVLIEADPGAPGARRAVAAAEVVAAVKDAVGVTVAAEVSDPGSLARSTGKLKLVIGHRARS